MIIQKATLLAQADLELWSKYMPGHCEQNTNSLVTDYYFWHSANCLNT
jgi:hypothetical protein